MNRNLSSEQLNRIHTESTKLADELVNRLYMDYTDEKERRKILRFFLKSVAEKTGLHSDPVHKENPETTEEQANELWNGLVQYCIDYLNKTNNSEIDAVYFSVDGLQSSRPYNKWCAGTDSGISFEEQKDRRMIIFEGL